MSTTSEAVVKKEILAEPSISGLPIADSERTTDHQLAVVEERTLSPENDNVRYLSYSFL